MTVGGYIGSMRLRSPEAQAPLLDKIGGAIYYSNIRRLASPLPTDSRVTATEKENGMHLELRYCAM
jgi:hypothetical protein